jgi:23S rRNA (adenine2503-C2)-methyltransferase
MGMGEPLYNFDAVRDAMKIAMDGEGIALSRRRITLSTSGVVPEIARVGEEIGCLLAISFHATTDPVRDALVPINRKWNIAALLDACRAYPRLSNAERITFEYVMLKGVNDSDADARRLVKLIAGIPAKINLIPFNPWPGAPYERSDPDRIEAFGAIVFASRCGASNAGCRCCWAGCWSRSSSGWPRTWPLSPAPGPTRIKPVAGSSSR